VQEPARGGNICLRRQKERLITSQRPPSNPVWVKPGLSVLGRRQECVRHLCELEGLSFSWKIATAEVKGWVIRIQFQRRRLTRGQMHHPPFHQIALWV
jgi:hypothetical protein